LAFCETINLINTYGKKAENVFDDLLINENSMPDEECIHWLGIANEFENTAESISTSFSEKRNKFLRAFINRPNIRTLLNNYFQSEPNNH